MIRKLKTTEDGWHYKIKKKIIDDHKDILKGVRNPDVGFDEADNVILRDRQTGKTFRTDTPINIYED
ncbi:MAG TPA: hypothetical protein DIS79_11365 [Bacteroidetes bacterium]|mgnify:CR=1 FL=1|nr:hypothetical protein [Bacteroidota bacterium]HRK05967.1 hypothetical protein [Chlorobiota bacterium]